MDAQDMIVGQESASDHERHKIEVVPFVMTPHSDADSLSVVDVFGGYTYVARTADWAGVTQAAYIPPDSIVDPTRPEFAWLEDPKRPGEPVRTKAKRLRGIMSFGVMVQVPDTFKIGDDVTDYLGVKHYNPPERMDGSPQHGRSKKDGTERFFGSGCVSPGDGLIDQKYDLENARKYHKQFVDGEEVLVTEKLDGTNARFSYVAGQQYCGSREQWKSEYVVSHIKSREQLVESGCPEEKADIVWAKISGQARSMNGWWKVYRETPGLAEWCRDHEGDVLYGEIAGNTNSIKYNNVNAFAAFDILRKGEWVDGLAARDELTGYGIPVVPLLYHGPYSIELFNLADGKTMWSHADKPVMREGCVIKPVVERYAHRIGRVCFKVVSGDYIERYR